MKRLSSQLCEEIFEGDLNNDKREEKGKKNLMKDSFQDKKSLKNLESNNRKISKMTIDSNFYISFYNQEILNYKKACLFEEEILFSNEFIVIKCHSKKNYENYDLGIILTYKNISFHEISNFTIEIEPYKES